MLVALAALVAAAAALSVSSPSRGEARAGADCSLSTTGLNPLTDMTKKQRYRRYRGGLYPNSRNKPTPAYQRIGVKASKRVKPIGGKIVLLSVGMSNASLEFAEFKKVADKDQQKNPRVTIVDGAQNGWDARRLVQQASYWDTVDDRLADADVSPGQVQAVWLKEAIAGEDRAFPKDAKALQVDLRAIVRTIKIRYPRTQLIYLSSRTYGGYAVTGYNPEPAAYDSGYAVRGTIQDRMRGKLKGPWLGWGPYLWTDGLRVRSDGLVWTCEDVEDDGTQPSATGIQKVADMLLTFFKTDPTARRWFLAH
jgi:hypothetical protein